MADANPSPPSPVEDVASRGHAAAVALAQPAEGIAPAATSQSTAANLDILANGATQGPAEPTAPTVQPAPSPSAPASAAPHEAARPPAAQVAPVMVSLVSGAAGTHRLVLRLDPPDLGRLEIRLLRAPDAGARVEITAERPATLALLHQDEPALHRALSEAGVPSDGRSLTMQLGQPGGQDAGAPGGGQRGAHRFLAEPAPGGDSDSVLELPPPPRITRTALDITA